ncbi:MAG: hypothetical protein ACJ71H_04980 [Nitrososphaeraceae archaeon]
MENIKTTTDCMKKALRLKDEAYTVTTRESHARWWDNKVELLKVINNAFESGAFTGEAYNELREAKNYLLQGENIAGLQARRYSEA